MCFTHLNIVHPPPSPPPEQCLEMELLKCLLDEWMGGRVGRWMDGWINVLVLVEIS